jgi:uncharacterized iron-regulated membrane protein
VKIIIRKIHRWLGLLMALQIIAWMASGLYFSWFPIETIRGEHLVAEYPRSDFETLDDLVPAWVAWNNLAQQLDGTPEIAEISIIERGQVIWYRIAGEADGKPFAMLVDGYSGLVRPRLSEEEAGQLASNLLTREGVIESIDWIEEAQPGSEIRGRDLPVWRVRFSEPESLSLYLHPWTGEVLARRTTRWRIFDFLWMLHIMDFDTRDDFNTPLLRIAATLGLLIAVSGVVYWCLTTPLFRRLRKRPVQKAA